MKYNAATLELPNVKAVKLLGDAKAIAPTAWIEWPKSQMIWAFWNDAHFRLEKSPISMLAARTKILDVTTPVAIRQSEKKPRSRQGSNLRGETPMDFKSIALTSRPRLHLIGSKMLFSFLEVSSRGHWGQPSMGMWAAEDALS